MAEFKVRISALIRHDKKILLVREPQHPKFHLPGGGLEEAEDLVEGLKRELFEELGLKNPKIGTIALAHSYLKNKRFIVEIVYWVDIDEPISLSPEIEEFVYFSPDNPILLEQNSPVIAGIRRLLQ